jgi:putative hemolysin
MKLTDVRSKHAAVAALLMNVTVAIVAGSSLGFVAYPVIVVCAMCCGIILRLLPRSLQLSRALDAAEYCEQRGYDSESRELFYREHNKYLEMTK